MPSPRRKLQRPAPRKYPRALVLGVLGVLAVTALVWRVPMTSPQGGATSTEHTATKQLKKKKRVMEPVTSGGIQQQDAATPNPHAKDFANVPRSSSSRTRQPVPAEPSCPNECARQIKPLAFKMAAVPHTASTSTDHVFKAAKDAWHNTSLNFYDRGFACPENQTVVEYSTTPGCESISTMSCLLDKFQYTAKTHSNYRNVKRIANKAFTILRASGQFVMSQYGMRTTWDNQFRQVFPEHDLQNISVNEWVDKAWWRHNLFTKLLATDTEVIWVSPKTISPSKEESDQENEKGSESLWLQNAVESLKEMPFFGLHHRLTETFELMGFRLCIPVTMKEHSYKKKRTVTGELAGVVKKRFKLDVMLLEAAESMFDEMVEDMREKQSKGVLCDLSTTLETHDTEIGLRCR